MFINENFTWSKRPMSVGNNQIFYCGKKAKVDFGLRVLLSSLSNESSKTILYFQAKQNNPLQSMEFEGFKKPAKKSKT